MAGPIVFLCLWIVGSAAHAQRLQDPLKQGNSDFNSIIFNQFQKTGDKLNPPACDPNEPLICSDPVQAICDSGPLPEPLLSEEAVHKKITDRLSPPYNDVDFLKKNQAAVNKIEDQQVAILKKWAPEGSKKDEELSDAEYSQFMKKVRQAMVRPEFVKLKEAKEVLKKSMDQYRIAYDSEAMAQLKAKGIDLEGKLFPDLKKKISEYVYANPAFKRETLPDPPKSAPQVRLPKPLPSFDTLIQKVVRDNLNYRIRGPLKPLDPPKNETIGQYDIASTVGQTKLANGHLSEFYSSEKEALEGYSKTVARICDTNPDNAFMSPRYRKAYFIFCPGILRGLLRGKSLDGALWTATHEMAHSVASSQSYISQKFDMSKIGFLALMDPKMDKKERDARIDEFNRLNDRVFLNDRYKSYLACMRTHYLAGIQNISDLIPYIQSAILPELERQIAESRSKDEIENLKATRKAFKEMVAITKKAPRSKTAVLYSGHGGHAPTGHVPASHSGGDGHLADEYDDVFHGYDNEMVADEFANALFADRLKAIPAATRLEAAKATYLDYCADRAGIDFQHPPAAARIANTFSRPDVRQLFGCKSAPRKPHCGITR